MKKDISQFNIKMFNSLKRLFDCIYWLGFKNGIRYWKMQNHALKNREYVPKLVKTYLEESERLKDNGELYESLILKCWAYQLKAHNKVFLENSEKM